MSFDEFNLNQNTQNKFTIKNSLDSINQKNIREKKNSNYFNDSFNTEKKHAAHSFKP